MTSQGTSDSALKAMSDAVLAITAELRVERVLQKMVDASRELAGARYAALGIPDYEGGFEQFITSGMSDELVADIGPLPRTHGLLGAMLEDPSPYRTPDISRDPRFQWWPAAHPRMSSFLGVPIVSKGRVIGAFYLTDKTGAEEFTELDQQLIEMLAAHAAIAIENARLYERSRELTVVEERNRLARELHDSVTQTLFSVVLTAEAASTLVERDPTQAREQIERLKTLAGDAVKEMRALIFELRSADVEGDGLVPALRKHIDVLRRVRRANIELTVEGDQTMTPALQRDLFRIAQEALNNALKHAASSSIVVRLAVDGERATLTVCDDGAGFDPAAPSVRSRRLGITSMRERAEEAGGTFSITSQPGEGTRVNVEVPLG